MRPFKPRVVAVAKDATHRFSKTPCDAIDLIVGQGVAGDAHAGATVKHRSRVRRDPSQPNLRQVHLLPVELIESLRAQGFDVAPSVMGENVTTQDIDLLALPTGTQLTLGGEAVVEITGLRNPCTQLDGYQEGLMGALRKRGPDGEIVRLAGVMGIVRAAGQIRPEDEIAIARPPGPPRALAPV